MQLGETSANNYRRFVRLLDTRRSNPGLYRSATRQQIQKTYDRRKIVLTNKTLYTPLYYEVFQPQATKRPHALRLTSQK